MNIYSEIFWHGTKSPVDAFTFSPKTQGLHLGTLQQAKSFGPHLYAFKITSDARTAKAKDTGEGWVKRARSARQRGKDVLVYLNRVEGIPLEAFDSLTSSQHDALSTMSDSAFLKLIPCATYSLLVLRDIVLRPLKDEDKEAALLTMDVSL